MESTSTNELKSELENFREQWLSEVRSRKTAPGSGVGPSGSIGTTPSVAGQSSAALSRGTATKPPTSTRPALSHIDDDYVGAPTFDEPPIPGASKKQDESAVSKEPTSALDHFEAAVMKEAQGSLGESLKLYRKAFRVCCPRISG
jgi:F-box protein 9